MTAKLLPFAVPLHEADRLRTVLQAMPVAVSWASLTDGSIEFTNHRFHHTFGYGRGELKTAFEFIDKVVLDPQQRAEFTQGFLHFLDSPPIEAMDLQTIELDVRRKDGEIIAVQLGSMILPEINAILTTSLDVTAQKRSERLALQLANEDALTGLLNRRAFDRATGEAVAAGREFSLAILDLDRFKAVNDSFGHQTGDAVLAETAQRLKKSLRSSNDVLARWGGDEFAAIIWGRLEQADIEELIERIEAELSLPIEVDGHQHMVDVSVGYARFPRDGRSAAEITRLADAAMYQNKGERRSVRS